MLISSERRVISVNRSDWGGGGGGAREEPGIYLEWNILMVQLENYDNKINVSQTRK